MNTTEIVAKVSRRSMVDQRTVQKVVRGLVTAVNEALAEGEKVQIANLGRFKTRFRKGWMARNPQTGEPAEVPSRTIVVFEPALKAKQAADSF